MSEDDGRTLYQVRALGFPLPLYLRAQEHADALVRELTLIAQARAGDAPDALGGMQHDLPSRFVALVDELTHRYDGVATDAERERDAAIDRGEQSVDLTYTVPAEVAEACRHLEEVFDDADYYCRAGEHLLTLATPPDALAFRRWFLGEFVRQIGGGPPVPWPVYAETAPDTEPDTEPGTEPDSESHRGGSRA